MTSELERDASGTIVNDRSVVGKIVSNSNINSKNISLRTGEEFSIEFLQDRGTRRVTNGHDVYVNHGPIVGSKSDFNDLPGYNEISGMIGLQRKYSFPLADKVKKIQASLQGLHQLVVVVLLLRLLLLLPQLRRKKKEPVEESDDDIGFSLFD